jgi:hypothetical protein
MIGRGRGSAGAVAGGKRRRSPCETSSVDWAPTAQSKATTPRGVRPGFLSVTVSRPSTDPAASTRASMRYRLEGRIEGV